VQKWWKGKEQSGIEECGVGTANSMISCRACLKETISPERKDWELATSLVILALNQLSIIK
jgi:hypothetical protein